MARCWVMLFLIITTRMCGCAPRASESSGLLEKTSQPAASHEAERVVLDFIASVQRGKYKTNVPDIPADAELKPADRVEAFRLLEKFLQSQDFTLWTTFIKVVGNKEDSADCFLRGTKGEHLVLLAGYHYDRKEWRVDAYEIPSRTFKRPAGESYSDYVTRSVSEAKLGAKTYKTGLTTDGNYVISHARD